MENMNKSDLRIRKRALKTKLMSALALLLVASIMMGTSTYAWFVLSTAPEVKGMSTTVGANGGLEIALLTDDKTNANDFGITSGIGDSMYAAGTAVTAANITWGNLIDLSDPSYGLGASSTVLYPAALKVANGETNPVIEADGDIFAFANYGVDGRVATVSGTTFSGKYVTNQNAFVITDTANASYGVRGIGTAAGAVDTNLFTFNRAKNIFLNTDVNDTAANALTTGTVEGLLNIVVKHSTSDNETYSQTELGYLVSALTQLQAAANTLETVVKNAIVAESYTQGFTPVALTDIDAAYMTSYTGQFGDLWGAIADLKTSIETKLTQAGAITGDTISWDTLSPIVNAILNTGNNLLFINGVDIATLRTLNETEKQDFAMELLTQPSTATTKQGLLADFAKIVDHFQTPYYVIHLDYGGSSGTNVSNGIALEADPATTYDYLATAIAYVENDNFQYAGGAGGATTNAIATFYGYAVDLAFRTNATGSSLLLQSEAAARVQGQTATMGAGSTFTFGENSSETMAAALRIAFIDADNNVLAIAKLGAKSNGSYPLVAYTPVVANGFITASDTALPDNALIALDANVAKQVTVLVYFDGESVDDFSDGATGTLNLQFASSETLTPMDYDFGGAQNNNPVTDLNVTATLDPATIVAGTGGTATLSAKIGDGEPLTGVTYQFAANYGEHITLENGVVTIDAEAIAQTITVGAVYTDENSVQHVGSVNIVITAP